MITIENETRIAESIGSISVMVIAGNYLVIALQEMVVWIICMFAIILCDLVAGVTHALMQGIKVRASKAFRRTFGKSVVYFAVVAMAVLLNIATKGEYKLDKWAVLAVAFVESLSIGGHILAMRGYKFNPIMLVKVLAKKKYELASDELEGIVEKKEVENEQRNKK